MRVPDMQERASVFRLVMRSAVMFRRAPRLTRGARGFERRRCPMRSPIWYWLRAVYVSRREYYIAVAGFAVVCGLLWTAGFWTDWSGLQIAAYALGGFGLLNFLVTLVGLYWMYGPPSG